MPLFIKTYDFVKIIYKVVHEFRKEYKHTLGAELQEILLNMLDEIIVANSLPDAEKIKEINKISRLFDRFKIRFRLAFEIGLVSEKKFACEQRRIEEIGRMIGGWRKWSEQ